MKVTGKSAANTSRKIIAVGGILLGKGTHEGRIAIVRRPRYGGEISPPKKPQGRFYVRISNKPLLRLLFPLFFYSNVV
jgi:hypothetical protein